MSAAVRNLASLGAPARATTAPRRAPRVVASATPAEKNDVAPRRAFLGAAFGALAAISASTASTAYAASLEEKEKEKEARKAALRAAAAQSAQTGRGASAFADSEYQLSEESKTPNFHTRQEEGLRSSGGA